MQLYNKKVAVLLAAMLSVVLTAYAEGLQAADVS